MSEDVTNKPPLIVLFDGTCGLCDSAVHFILARDRDRRFRFAPQQSQLAMDLMSKHGLTADQIDSIILIDGENVYLKSNATLRIAMELPDPWPLVGALVFIPEPLRNAAYDFVARHRKEWFKSRDACEPPTPENREQFLA